jgi:DNA-binding HxlR family transcriptional regulator
MSIPEPSPSQSEPIEETCGTQPMGRALRLLGDAPTLLIVYTLLRGTYRFGELRAAVGVVSAKTLTQRLRLLEGLGFVVREGFAEIPPRVEYHLTEKGLALADIMAAIKQFGERYLSDGPPETVEAPAPADLVCDQLAGE